MVQQAAENVATSYHYLFNRTNWQYVKIHEGQ